MARRNKKLVKLRSYRDRLIADNVNLRTEIREHEQRQHETRKALSNEDTLRAYAICSGEGGNMPPLEFVEKNEAIAELTLVYKMLSIERQYTDEIGRAVVSRDLLRIAALCADHQVEQIAHDKMLSTWSVDHGFTNSLRGECSITGK